MRTETRRLLITTAISTLVLGGIGLGTYFAVKNPAPGTNISGFPINDPLDAPRVVHDIAEAVHQQPIRIEADGRHVEATVNELGLKVDEALMVTIAQQQTGVSAWVEALTTGSVTVELATTSHATDTLTKAAETLTKEPVNGNVTVSGAEVRTFAAENGKIVTPDAITKALKTAIETNAKDNPTQWPASITIKPEVRDQEPAITQPVVDQTAAKLKTLVETPFVVTNPKNPEKKVELASGDIAGLVTVTTDAEAIDPNHRLVVSMAENLPPVPSTLTAFLGQAVLPAGASAQVVDRSLSPKKGASEAELTDTASITGRVTYEPGPEGILPNTEETWKAVAQTLANGAHTTAIVANTQPEANLDAIGVKEPVGTFTTFFTEGQQRNTNIKRVAELVNGTLIAPGAVYELNHAVGPRTAAKGFVEGGAIFEGKLTTSLGGGVSQFATTFFNAAWFSGMQINTFKPHTYYFDRYPLGREATIDYPGVNLEIKNTSPHAVLVEATTTANSVTVTFWSTRYFKVDQLIGKPVPANGGTNVRISRTTTAPDGKVDHFERTVHYRKQPDQQ